MILVAGGTGTLGTLVVQTLAAGGTPVRVLTRDVRRAAHLTADIVEVVVGDVREPATLGSIMHGVTTVVSAVQGIAGVDPGGVTEVDLNGNVNLLAAARAAGVRRFVLASAYRAAPDSPLDLRRVKYQAEQAVLRSGLEWTIVRPTVYLETWLGILGEMIDARGAVTLFGRGTNPINFVSARDVAALIEHAVRSTDLAGATLDIGGPQDLTLDELAQAVLAKRGLDAKIKHVPVAALKVVSTLLRPVKPSIATLARFAIVMDTTDMRLTADTARATVPDLPVTRPADILDAVKGA
jgi:uncharacterized protein YbjT (DUF2867 family)